MGGQAKQIDRSLAFFGYSIQRQNFPYGKKADGKTSDFADKTSCNSRIQLQ